MAPVIATIGRLLAANAPITPDADLLARFVASRDESAFAELIRRHGRMVRSVAHRSVRDTHLADDVAQAVFLILASKAGQLAHPDRLAAWLFGVTRRLAGKTAGRRRRHALRELPLNEQFAAREQSGWNDLLQVLDEELASMPEAEKAPLVLCYLEGLTQDEAARASGCSVRTLRRRLAAGRERLRDRLQRRGVELGSALAALAVGQTAVADRLVWAASFTSVGSPSNRAAELARDGLRSAGWLSISSWALGAVTLMGLATGLVVSLQAGGTTSTPTQKTPLSSTAPVLAMADGDLPDGAILRLGTTDLRHPDLLTQLRFSADGSDVVSYGHGKVRTWNADTGASARPTKLLHDITTTYGTTFLTKDGTHVIAPHVELNPRRFSLREYDLTTGGHKELFVLPPRIESDGKETPLGSKRFALSPDESVLVEGNRQDAYLWDLKTCKIRHHLKLQGTSNWQFVFAPDGKQLFTAGGDTDTIQCWDVTTGKEMPVLTRNGGKGGLIAVAVSPDGRWVAGVSNIRMSGVGTQFTVWDNHAPQGPRIMLLEDGFGLSGTVVFGPGGVLYLLSVPFTGWDVTITKWDVANGKLLARWSGPHPGQFGHLQASISLDGRTLAVGTYHGVIRLYNTRNGKEIVVPASHRARVTDITFDREGREIRTAAADGEVCMWDAATGNQRHRRAANLQLTNDETGGMIRTQDGKWAVSYRVNVYGPFPPWAATLWDVDSGKRKYNWGVGGRVKELISVPGGRLLVGLIEGRGGYSIQAWDITTGVAMPEIFCLFNVSRTRYALFPNGKTIQVIDEESVVGYDLTTGKEQFTWKLADHEVLGSLSKEERRPGLIRAVTISPDGKTLAVAVGGLNYTDVTKRTHNLVLVESETGKVIRRVPTPETSSEFLVFSPDGRWLAGQSCVWETATLMETRRFPAQPSVTTAGFSPNGQRVVTGHQNGTAMVWPVTR